MSQSSSPDWRNAFDRQSWFNGATTTVSILTVLLAMFLHWKTRSNFYLAVIFCAVCNAFIDISNVASKVDRAVLPWGFLISIGSNCMFIVLNFVRLYYLCRRSYPRFVKVVGVAVIIDVLFYVGTHISAAVVLFQFGKLRGPAFKYFVPVWGMYDSILDIVISVAFAAELGRLSRVSFKDGKQLTLRKGMILTVRLNQAAITGIGLLVFVIMTLCIFINNFDRGFSLLSFLLGLRILVFMHVSMVLRELLRRERHHQQGKATPRSGSLSPTSTESISSSMSRGIPSMKSFKRPKGALRVKLQPFLARFKRSKDDNSAA